MTDPFKDLVWGAMIKAGLVALFAAVPFLGLPVISGVVTIVVTMFANAFYDVVKETMDLRLIQFKNEEHRREFDKASVSLRIFEREFGPDSAQFRAAREAHQQALARFVQWRPAAASV